MKQAREGVMGRVDELDSGSFRLSGAAIRRSNREVTSSASSLPTCIDPHSALYFEPSGDRSNRTDDEMRPKRWARPS